jgi:exonuclease III
MVSDSILCWNVRGLNSRAHQDVLHELVASEQCSIICIQETKKQVFSDYDIAQLLGTGFDYTFLPSAQTRGGDTRRLALFALVGF